MKDNTTDAEIVRLFFSRDENAILFSERKYGAYVYKVAYSILKDKSDCQECLDDMYMALWNRIPPEPPKSLLAYMTIIIRIIAINYIKSNNTFKRVRNTSIDDRIR